jgi:four helix bundle protein
LRTNDDGARDLSFQIGGVPTFIDPPGFADWEATLPPTFIRDPIWRTLAYRFGVWLGHLARQDYDLLFADRRSRNVADQLLRAVDGISANLSEGYARTTGKERARYYEYALATAREARDWYFKARDVLGDNLVDQRLQILDRIIRILTAVAPREREASPRRPRPRPDQR